MNVDVHISQCRRCCDVEVAGRAEGLSKRFSDGDGATLGELVFSMKLGCKSVHEFRGCEQTQQKR